MVFTTAPQRVALTLQVRCCGFLCGWDLSNKHSEDWALLKLFG